MTFSEKLLNTKFRIGLLPTIDYVTFSAQYSSSEPGDIKRVADTANKEDTTPYASDIDYLRGKDIIIMQLVADGFTALQIAGKLALSNRTVEHRILELRKKLSCKSVTHLAIMLLRANIIK